MFAPPTAIYTYGPSLNKCSKLLFIRGFFNKSIKLVLKATVKHLNKCSKLLFIIEFLNKSIKLVFKATVEHLNKWAKLLFTLYNRVLK